MTNNSKLNLCLCATSDVLLVSNCIKLFKFNTPCNTPSSVTIP